MAGLAGGVECSAKIATPMLAGASAATGLLLDHDPPRRFFFDAPIIAMS
ncbi:hypothetical protein [Bradyrhizobium sp.]